MQHEVRIGQAFQPVDHLLAVAGAQRGGADRLRLAAGEQRRTMRARQEADHRLDRADLGGRAAVDAGAVLEDGTAHDIGLDLLDRLDRDHLRLRVVRREGGLRLVARSVQRVRAGRLVGQLVGGGDVLADQVLELGLDRRIIGNRNIPRVLGRLFGQVDDQVANLLDLVMGEDDRAQHDVLGKLAGLRFHHHHGIAGGGHNQVERAGGGRFLLGVERIFAVLVADARSADRPHERHARDGQRGRGGDHRQDIGLDLAVIGHDLGDDVDFVIETFGEQRPHRAVDQAGDQRFLFGGAALTLEEATRDAAGGKEFFLVVDGEREEILPFLDRLGGGHGAQHHGFTIGGENGTIGLTGNAARFQGEGLSAPLHRYSLYVEHFISFSPRALLPKYPEERVLLPGVPSRSGAGPFVCPKAPRRIAKDAR